MTTEEATIEYLRDVIKKVADSVYTYKYSKKHFDSAKPEQVLSAIHVIAESALSRKQLKELKNDSTL